MLEACPPLLGKIAHTNFSGKRHIGRRECAKRNVQHCS